ncbi:MAG: hypothetical protein J6K19_10000 [Prevotella sp.]|nr:hypothetical protein [Prevotella sp.]
MFKNPFRRKKYEPLPYDEVFDYGMTRYDEPKCKYTVMHNAVRVHDLKFEPVHEEVIYVENEYDEAANRCICDNIDLIRRCFAKRNFMFIYLPLIGKDLMDKSIWRYHYPDRETGETGELPALKSDYLLDFMKRPEHRPKIKPCFVRYNYSFNETEFYGGKAETSWTDFFDTFEFDISEAKDVKDYFECLSEHIAGKLFWWSGLCSWGKREYEDADDAFDNETMKLLEDVRYKIALLRRKGISDVILSELVKPDIELSRIIISKDYRITLPEYNNTEITMTPLVKAVFLLFLKHPEGICFKSLPDHRKELSVIYDSIRGCAGSSKRIMGIRKYSDNILNVTDPLNNSINEKCTRIKEAFLLKIHESQACNYFITGERGKPKKIALPQNLIVWED